MTDGKNDKHDKNDAHTRPETQSGDDGDNNDNSSRQAHDAEPDKTKPCQSCGRPMAFHARAEICGRCGIDSCSRYWKDDTRWKGKGGKR